MKIFYRFLRRLIIKNRYLIKEASPYIPKSDTAIKHILTGGDLLERIKSNNGNFFIGFNSQTSVLIKVNLNSSLPFPASVSLDMLEAVIDALLSLGVKKICIGDCTALGRLPTRKIMLEKELYKLKRPGVKIKSFDYGIWKSIPIEGQFYNRIILPSLLYKFDRVINLSNIKTHQHAGFTGATKNLVGFMHPFQRFELHKNNLEERIAELPLAIIPDLNIIDARKVFIDGGPDKGTITDANTVIIDSNLLRADISAYRILIEKQTAEGIKDLEKDYTQNIFFKHFMKINGGTL